MVEESDQDLEFLKLSFDWCKHISTLSTGSLLLMVTFIEKFENKMKWQFLVVVALGSLVISILGTLAVQFEHLVKRKYSTATTFGLIAGVLSVGGFVLGIGALAVFATKNL